MATFSDLKLFLITRTVFLLASLLASVAWARDVKTSGRSSNWRSFNVIDYHAVGDGKTDDTEAFAKAWDAACKTSGSAAIIVPRGKTFLVGGSAFNGPCQSSYISVEVLGNIVAPSKSAWHGKDTDSWLIFHGVKWLSVTGSGTIDGKGATWWNKSLKHGDGGRRPKALVFDDCSHVSLQGLSIVNSPMFHVFIESDVVSVTNLTITSPGDSPNTDGIHVQKASSVAIDHCQIGTGDDCVSIGTDSMDVNVTNVRCGPGHGISIGSLGKGGSHAKVDGVLVKNVKLIGTANGARIKTWQGGSGYARNIRFEKLTFENAENPIIIDQYYCDEDKACHEQIVIPPILRWVLPRRIIPILRRMSSAVKISDVSYIDATGTSATNVSINLKCSKTTPCTNLLFHNVQVRSATNGKSDASYCSHADPKIAGVVQPALTC